jgi:hypothetical protein
MKEQKSFTESDIKKKLEGYTQVQKKDIEKLEPGDRVRYITNGEFRGGGAIKINKYPDYIVLMNVINKATWCMQLKTDPSIIVYAKKASVIEKERKKKDELYKLFKAGKLVKK